MNCKYCGSDKLSKNGFVRGLQRYLCKECKRNWTTLKPAGYPLDMRIQALRLSLEGLGIRAIGRFLKVSNVTVLYWIRNFATMLKTEGDVWVDPNIKAVSVIQMDEFWHFTQKNGINFGFGWLYVPKKGKLLPFFVEDATKNQQKPSG